jgi:ABC-type uncharacterized transport system ATPase subunit
VRSRDPVYCTMSPGKTPLLKLCGITKQFAQVTANSAVDFQVGAGEVVGLLGENGAGKTTLMNIAFGLYRPDAGSILVNDKSVDIASTADAMAYGIGMVHQHAHVVGRHTVLENIIAGLPGRRGFFDRKGAAARLAEIRSRYGLHLEPSSKVADLAVGEKQRLDIIRMLFRRSNVLILDEPTSVLTPAESRGLFDAIRALAADGMGIVLISHKLDDVRAIASRVVVMRKGVVVAEIENDGRLSSSQLAELMCGHEPERIIRAPSLHGDVKLELRQVVLQHLAAGCQRQTPFDLSVSAGEIVGIAGVSGNGQVALAETIAGLRNASAGLITIDGQYSRASELRSVTATSISYIPEDRIGSGFASGLSAATNMVLHRYRMAPFSYRGWIDRNEIASFAARLFAQYKIHPPDPKLKISMFSGGNQQKAIVAREMAFSPKIVVIAQPTRGLDVAATSFVHRQLINLKNSGSAIVMISDDLEEIFQLSDRIAVMHGGRIVLDKANELLTLAEVGMAMSGASLQGLAS